MPLVADAVAVIVNLVLLACALPLAMRLVPLQNLFGFRTKASTASEKAWYTLNAAFGKTVSAICGAAVAAGAALRVKPQRLHGHKARLKQAAARRRPRP